MKTLERFLNKNYVISLPQLVSLVGHKSGVYRLVDKGVISKVHPDGLGYFCLPETEEGTAHFAIVKNYYPNCIFSGKTALSLYDLSLDYYGKLDVDIPKGQNLRNELLNVHRVVESKMTGIEKRKFENKGIPFEVKIYGPERTLFEAYKYYKGLDSYFYALKQYKKLFLNMDSPGEQFYKILKFNKKVGREMINLLEMESK